MPSIDGGAKAWELELAGRIGTAIQARRKQMGLTAIELAEKTKTLGYPVTRVAISKIETNARAGKFDVAELLVLAAALEVPPIALLFPDAPDQDVRMLPGATGPTFHALAWFSGDRGLAWPGPEMDPEEARDQANAAVADPDSPAATVLRLTRERAALHGDLMLSRFASKRDIKVGSFDDEAFDRAVEYDARLIGKIDEKTDEIRKVMAQGESQ